MTLGIADFRWGLIKDDMTREVIRDLVVDVSTIRAGSVTSVGLTAPTIFAVTGSPVTSAGTLALSLATQAANTLWAGPASGAAATPAFRAFALADVPAATFTADATGRGKFAASFVDTALIGAGQVTRVKLAGGFSKAKTLAGAAAGNVTVTDIATGDEIVMVSYFDPAGPTFADLTSEFTITGANTINNGGGTSSAGGFLIVVWCDLT